MKDADTMTHSLTNFLRDENGAVTVDWVVLTAAIVGLGIAVLTSVASGTTNLAGDVEHELGDIAIDLEL